MSHFLAKVGRKPWSKQASVLALITIPSAYLGLHCYGHKVIRNFLVAEDGPNQKAAISENLQSLIVSVREDIKDLMNQSMLPKSVNKPNFEAKPPPFKWFASCTLMPVTFGLTYSKQGVIIGLPKYFNYDKVEDLPDDLFFVRQVKLLKGKEAAEGGGEGEAPAGETQKTEPSVWENDGKQIKTVARLDRDSEEVKEYAKTLVLSEKAKKFAIAREIFIADSFRVLSMSSIILASCVIAMTISRGAVHYLKLADAHVTQRLTVYMVSTFASYMNYNFVSDSSNRFYVLEADKRAATVNEDYLEGAKEYFEKTLERNKALRELSDSFQSIYDERGNVKQPIIRFTLVPLTERLKLIRREKIIRAEE